MPPDVSVIIPCYNHGRFLGETIASIERARSDYLREIIIVNDGSTEPETIEALERLQTSGYLVIHQANRGVGMARNAGIRKAGGKYILPVDSDNRIRKPYLTKAVEILEEDSTAGVVYGDAEYFGERSGRWSMPDFDFVRLVLWNYIDTCALFRKRLWEEIGGYDEHMIGWQDWEFWLRSALSRWRFVHLPEIAFEYRVRGGSMLSRTIQHRTELYSYIFSKPELALVGAVRTELLRLRTVEGSRDYRLGKRLLEPLRKVRNTLRRNGEASTETKGDR